MNTAVLILKRVKFIPEMIEPGILYYTEEFNTAVHLCACGSCGEHVVTPINPEYGWTLSLHGEVPTLTPSIGNDQYPCKSHYHVTEGKIVWC